MDQKQWWDKNLPTKVTALKSWVGDENAITKVIPAKYIVKNKFKSVLDVGCADGSFRNSLANAGSTASYSGIDISPYWQDKVDFPFNIGDIENLSSFSENAVDVVFIRHIVEHCPYFDKALSEAVRIASKSVIIVFFNKPQTKDVIRDVVDGQIVYSNFYSKKKIEKFLKEKLKVTEFDWKEVDSEEILFVTK